MMTAMMAPSVYPMVRLLAAARASRAAFGVRPAPVWTFVALGVMHVGWMAAVAALIFVEKVLPRGVGLGRAVGVLLATGGAAVLLTGRMP